MLPIDPTMMHDQPLDPEVVVAMKSAGLDHVEDMNHNGKLDIQDVALMKAAQAQVQA